MQELIPKGQRKTHKLLLIFFFVVQKNPTANELLPVFLAVMKQNTQNPDFAYFVLILCFVLSYVDFRTKTPKHEIWIRGRVLFCFA